jgi:organic hydroperoxide reductase OsmC/OhrA
MRLAARSRRRYAVSMSEYVATVAWSRGAGEAFVDRRYSRRHEWSFDGGTRVAASASPQVVKAPYSDAAAVDPEEAMVASLASCHMLFFLDFAARAGFRVRSYRDDALGVMSKDERQREWMSLVTLRPHVVFDGDKAPTAADVDALHHKAHDHCYIANSLKAEVRVEGRFETGA